MSKDFVLQAVYLILVAAEVTTSSTLTCPPGTTTLVTTEDVNEYSVEHAAWGYNFLTVVSASPDFIAFFASNDKPNTGYLQFKERFVLLGFSTSGHEILAGDYRYVSQLSVKTNSSFPENYNYSREYNVSSFEEKYFPFDEGVLTSEMEFTVLDFVVVSGTHYYWKLRLFGCREVDALQVEPALSCPLMPSTSIVAALPLPSCSEVAAPVINPSVTNVQSDTLSDQMDTSSMLYQIDTSRTSSSSRRQETVTITEAVSSCSTSSEVVVIESAVPGSSFMFSLAGVVVLLLIIIIILATVLIVLLVVIYRKRSVHWNKKSNNKHGVPGNENENGMVINELYSGPDEADCSPASPTCEQVEGGMNLAGIKEGNEYSSIDQLYPVSSNDKYEYMRMGDEGEELGGDGSPITVAVADARVDSTVNPAYSSIG